MSKKLPIVTHPTFTKTLPVSKKVVRFRPFTVKEEKILLMAKEAEDAVTAIDAIKQVIGNCCIDGIDISALPLVDLEYLWIKIRAKSSNNVIELMIKDSHGKKCEAYVDLEEIEVTIPEGHTNKIEVTETMGLIMRYPGIDMFSDFQAEMTDVETIKLMTRCIEFVYSGDDMFKLADYTQDEINEFVDSWDTQTFDKLKDFFATMPKLEKGIEYTDSMGEAQTMNLSGIVSFFR